MALNEYPELMFPCECRGHALSVSYDEDGDSFYVMTLTAYWEGDSLWTKIKRAYRLVRYGNSLCTDVILKKKDAERLAEFIREKL